jgi:hypothetical protein
MMQEPATWEGRFFIGRHRLRQRTTSGKKETIMTEKLLTPKRKHLHEVLPPGRIIGFQHNNRWYGAKHPKAAPKLAIPKAVSAAAVAEAVGSEGENNYEASPVCVNRRLIEEPASAVF